MKKLFLIIIGLCLCTALYADMNTYIIGSGGSVSAANGWIGTTASAVAGGWGGDRYTYFSPFITTTPGNVSYMYIDCRSSLNTAWIRPCIYNSDGDLLASADNCTATQVGESTVYRYTLGSSITIASSTTYWLGFASADTDFQYQHANTSGSTSRYGTFSPGDFGTCPTGVHSAVEATASVSATYPLRIWASNLSTETGE